MHPVALEDRMLFDLDEDIEITRRPAAQTCLTLARKTDAGAGLYPCGDVDRQRAVLFGPAGAAADLARVLDHLAHAIAGGAGALDRKEALLRAHLAHARTGRTGHRLGATLGPGAMAAVAGDRGRDIDGLLDALEGLFQADAQVVAQVRAALRPRPCPAAATAAPAHEVAEQVLEHVRECAGEIAVAREATTRPATAATHAAVKGCMAETVIGGLLVGILQNVISLVHFLELGFGIGVVGVAVGVQLLGLLAIGLLQLLGGSTARDAKHVVEITFRHGSFPCGTGEGRPVAGPPPFRFQRPYFRLFSPRSSKSASTMSSSTERGPSSSPLASAACAL